MNLWSVRGYLCDMTNNNEGHPLDMLQIYGYREDRWDGLGHFVPFILDPHSASASCQLPCCEDLVHIYKDIIYIMAPCYILAPRIKAQVPEVAYTGLFWIYGKGESSFSFIFHMFSLDSYNLWLYIVYNMLWFHMISYDFVVFSPFRLRFLLVSPRRWGRRRRNGRNSATRWRTCCARRRRPSSHATLHRSCRRGTWGGWNWGNYEETFIFYGKNYGKTLGIPIFYHILWEKLWKHYGKTMVSCRFSLKSTQWWRKQCHKPSPQSSPFL